MKRPEGVTRGIERREQGAIRIFEAGNRYQHQDSDLYVSRRGVTVANGDHCVASMALTAAEFRELAEAANTAAARLDAEEE